MNIAYLTTVYPSVSHTFIRRELLELEKRGHTIHRFSIRAPEHCVDSVDHQELQKTFYCLNQSKHKIVLSTLLVFITHPFKWLLALKTLLRFSKLSERGLITHLAYLAEACVLLLEMKKSKVTHIHTHFGTNATTVALVIKMLSDIGYSFTAHGPDEFDAAIGLNLKEKIEQAEFVVAISNYGAAQLKRWVSLEHWQKIIIVGCTIDEEFMSQADGTAHIEQKNQIVCVARLSAQKGIFTLLEALASFKQKKRSLNLVLAGDGELRDEVEAFIQQKQLTDNVTITGWIDGKEVRKHILESKAMVLASFAEGLPVVIMEAFALKKPVLTTWVAGIPELVKGNHSGWLYTPNDVQSLTQALIELDDTPQSKLSEMGQAGYKDVLKTHSVMSEVSKLEQALLGVLGNQ